MTREELKNLAEEVRIAEATTSRLEMAVRSDPYTRIVEPPKWKAYSVDTPELHGPIQVSNENTKDIQITSH